MAFSTDNANNSASASFGPIKIDKTAPVLAPSVSPNPVYLNEVATAIAGATDSGSGVASKSCGSVLTNTVGTKTVTCTATDIAGNIKTASISYRVIYRFDGFSSPINIPGYTNACGSPCLFYSANGNSTIPVKFQLKDANGKVVKSTSLPIWLVPQKGGVITAPLNASIFTAQSASQEKFEKEDNQYQFNWKTKGFTPVYYWRIGVKLDDGQIYYVIIKLR